MWELSGLWERKREKPITRHLFYEIPCLHMVSNGAAWWQGSPHGLTDIDHGHEGVQSLRPLKAVYPPPPPPPFFNLCQTGSHFKLHLVHPNCHSGMITTIHYICPSLSCSCCSCLFNHSTFTGSFALLALWLMHTFKENTHTYKHTHLLFIYFYLYQWRCAVIVLRILGEHQGHHQTSKTGWRTGPPTFE